MPRKAKKGSPRYYFNQGTEDAIIRHNKETRPHMRERIYNEHIRTPFEKLAENIILSTGRDVEITTAEGICQVSAGRDLEIAEAMGNGIYSAGRDAEIEKASADVTVNAGRRKDVCTTIASDAAPNSTPKNFDIF